MKVNYLLKSAFLAAFFFVIASLNAATYYVSSTGSNGDGLSEATAFNSLQAAVDVAADNDIIIVVGEIEVEKAVVIDKFIKIEGKEDMDVVIASTGSDRILNVELPEGNGFFWAANIIFDGGNVEGNGGAVSVTSGRAHFTSCYFENNTASDGGGAVYAEGDESVALEFYACTFTGNSAGGSGGAVRVAMVGEDAIQGPNLSFDYCLLMQNKSVKRGGALSIEGSSIHMFATSVDNNSTTEEGTGGIRFTGNTSTSFYAESCSFSRNLGFGDHAGFMIIDGEASKTVTFVNSTITLNTNGVRRAPDPETGVEDGRSEGGAGCIWATGGGMSGTIITFVNTIMAQNTSGYGGNGNNGSGLTFQDGGYIFRVYNSLIVGNVAGGMSANGAVDVSYRANASEFTVKNSIIGCVFDAQSGAFDDVSTWFPAGNPWTVQDNPAIANKSKMQQYEYTTNGSWVALDESGLYMEEGGARRFNRNGAFYYGFINGAYASRLGDPQLLFDEYETELDLFLATREVTGGTIWAGSAQGIIEDATPRLSATPSDPIAAEWGTSIANVVSNNNAIKVMNTVVDKDGYINIDFGKSAGKAKVELISISGQIVKTLLDNQINGKYPCNVSGVDAGVYLVKITTGSATTTERVIIK